MRGFRSTEAARLAGLSLRQLDHWDRAGLVRP
ncbi:MAG: MerR family transcriptional regulator, partial [Moorellales bacterium]